MATNFLTKIAQMICNFLDDCEKWYLKSMSTLATFLSPMDIDKRVAPSIPFGFLLFWKTRDVSSVATQSNKQTSHVFRVHLRKVRTKFLRHFPDVLIAFNQFVTSRKSGCFHHVQTTTVVNWIKDTFFAQGNALA